MRPGRRRGRWRKFFRILLRVAAALAVFLVIAGLAGLVVVQSGWFHEYVRQRIIAELERATGGRVEIGRFSFRGPTLTASIGPVVLHGTEAAGDPPLLRAESVTLGLRIVSIAERKIDLAFIKVEKPQVRVVLDGEGGNNLPGRGSGNWAEQVLNLAVGHYEINNGVFELDQRSTPINLRGDGLALQLTYDARTPSYLAQISSRGVRVTAGGAAPVELGFAAQVTLEKSRLVISSLNLSTARSRARLTGTLDNPVSPHGTLNIQATASVGEAAGMFALPMDRTGSADFAGTLDVDFAQLSETSFSGAVNARGLGYSNGRVHIRDASVRAAAEVSADRIDLKNVQASALGGQFKGSLTLAARKRLHVEGSVDGFAVAKAAAFLTDRPLPWDGTLSGDVTADTTLGEADAIAHARLAIAAAAEGTPISGLVDASYLQQAGEISLGDSYFATPATRLDVSGALGRRVDVRLRSTDLADLLAVLPLVEDDPPKELPLKLAKGAVVASGAVTGPLDDPRFRGQLNVTGATVEGHAFDEFDAAVDVSRSALSTSRFRLTRGMTEALGTATLTAAQGSYGSNSAISAQFNLRNANLEQLTKEAGAGFTVQGTATAAVSVSGSLGQPQADATVTVINVHGFGEVMDRITATVKATRDALEVSDGQAEDGPGRVAFSGSYKVGTGPPGSVVPASSLKAGTGPPGSVVPASSLEAARPDWKTGEAQLQAGVRNLPYGRVEALKALDADLDARLSGDVRAQARVTNGDAALESAFGTLTAQSVTLRGQPVGELAVTADTRGDEVTLQVKGNVDAANLEGNGSWRLSGDQPGSASVRFSRLTLEQAHRLAMLAGAAPQDQSDLPLEGVLQGGSIAVNLALRHPRDFAATVMLEGVQFSPKAGQTLGLGVQPQDLVLASAQPVGIAINAREVRIQPARLTGRDTNLEVSGVIPFSSAAGGADLAVRGMVNLSALQLVSPSLLARGNATVEATLRGELTDPALNGRMDLKAASLYLKDVSTGLDNVNGGVLFNRNRATIDKLTAQIGAGTLALGGFVEFGTPLVYRLKATAQQVRFRLPVDLSTTFSANLALDGTSDASSLSGSLTLNRAAFNPHTDLGELFSAFSTPQQEESPNDYLRGVQFDVRIVSAPNFELQTSLTRDVQSEVDLRLRGTPRQPVLQGSVSVDSGQVQVFGNQYNIDRGDIRFTNPIRIEPVFDLSLETKVSGVSVNITFTGTMDKLKTNYSSDPPLEPSKIIALLAVGRSPNQYSGTASTQAGADSSDLSGAAGGLVSQALSAQLSSKMQRFLGASRVKIDPTMTGVDNTPQARLTFEQQVSKDVTMTYITNLNYTAEQIVRLQWDLNKNWSAIAVRDANGLFGIDFQYRTRFK